MDKLKRILALTGAILLLGLYAVTFLLAVLGNENTHDLLMISLICTVVIPCLFYGIGLLAKILRRK